jgi:hypothetical protein
MSAMTARYSYWSQCHGKARHSKRDAEWYKRRMERRGDTGLVVYQCAYCYGGWHVGHEPKGDAGGH